MSTAPTIGRIVHFRTYENDRTLTRCVPALVTEVHENSEVGLMIVSPTGSSFDRRVRWDEAQDPATWHWPCVRTEET